MNGVYEYSIYFCAEIGDFQTFSDWINRCLLHLNADRRTCGSCDRMSCFLCPLPFYISHLFIILGKNWTLSIKVLSYFFRRIFFHGFISNQKLYTCILANLIPYSFAFNLANFRKYIVSVLTCVNIYCCLHWI